MASQEDLLDKLKLDIFKNKKIGALFGSLLCNIEWKWSNEISTACTNGTYIKFNESWFSSLSPENRLFVGLHEMQHILRLHQIRRGKRDPHTWNIACDIVINESLVNDGFRLPTGGILESSLLMDNSLESEEDVYDFILKNGTQINNTVFGVEGDTDDLGDPEEGEECIDLTPQEARNVTEIVTTAISQAKQSGQAGGLAGQISSHLENFLNPIVPWDLALRKFFIELGGASKKDWSRRNRRFRNVYMAKRVPDRNALTKVMFFLDTSGSVTDEELQKYLGEIKHVQETLNPLELQVVQFDYFIQKTDVYKIGDKITGMDISGRGGTSLEPVKKLIDEEKPSVVVIFSDLECSPMERPKVPVIWITQKTPYSWVPDYGTQYLID